MTSVKADSNLMMLVINGHNDILLLVFEGWLIFFSVLASMGTLVTKTRGTWLSDPVKQIIASNASSEMRDVDCIPEDYPHIQKLETYIFGLIQRQALPPRPSKPRTSLVHDAHGISWVKQSDLCCKEEQHSPKQVAASMISSVSLCSNKSALQACHNIKQEHYLEMEFSEDGPPPHYHHKQSVQNEPAFYHKPSQQSTIDTSHSTSLDYRSCRLLQGHLDSSNSEPDSPQHFHSNPLPALSKPHQTPCPDELLVSAEYIPAQPCRSSTRACTHHLSNPQSRSGLPKLNTFYTKRSITHQEQQPTASQIQSTRFRGGQKKCRSNEDRSVANRKLGKKASRSQSENSLPVPERKYNTVERGSRGSQSRNKKPQQGGGSYRRWQSTLELSQDEADQPSTHAAMQGSSTSNQKEQYARRTRKSHHTSNVYQHRSQHDSPHRQQIGYQLERDQVSLCQPGVDYTLPHQGESESSMSDADSPDSSSLSSDSDESGLVWPQQLPPQLSLPSPPAPPGAPQHPKAFVKIKASHALKKKILRFRTGSLKVMTTV